jgi:hypothetical protein
MEFNKLKVIQVIDSYDGDLYELRCGDKKIRDGSSIYVRLPSGEVKKGRVDFHECYGECQIEVKHSYGKIVYDLNKIKDWEFGR